MKFIQNLSFRLKLLLIAAPPLLGVILYSVILIFNLVSEKSHLEANKNQIQEIEVLSKIVHFLQMERGLSVGFINSNGIKNINEISNVKTKVANALEEIKSVNTEIRSAEKISSFLSELPQKRAQIDNLQISASDVGAYYTKAISSILISQQ